MGGGNKGSLPIRNFAGCSGAGTVPVTLEEVKARLKALQPGPIGEAGEAYLAAAKALSEASRRLHRHAELLAEHWKGDAAQGAVKQMGQLNATACELANKTQQTGSTAKWLSGDEMLGWYKHQGDVIGDGFIRNSGDDENARKVLAALSHRYNEANMSMPESVDKDLPPRDIGERGDNQAGNNRTNAGNVGGAGGIPHTRADSVRHQNDNPSPGAIHGSSREGSFLGGSASESGPYDPGGKVGGTDLAGLTPNAEHLGAGGIGLEQTGLGRFGSEGSGVGEFGQHNFGSTLSPGGIPKPGEIERDGVEGRNDSRTVPSSTGARNNGISTPTGSRDEDSEERDRACWIVEDEELWSPDDNVTPSIIE
jgi:uncharacterized protein YukE